MNRIRLSWAVALVALFPVAARGQNAVVIRDVNLRSVPSAASATTIIEPLATTAELWVLSATRTSGYYEARTASGRRGWVWGNYIRITGEITSPADGGPPETYRGCELEGNASQERYRVANRLKNRVTAPTAAQINAQATLAALLAPSDDETRWDQAQGASIVGFVASVTATGGESVNCGETQGLYTDTHIDIVLVRSDTARRERHVVVEVTPRWRAFMESQGVDWTSPTLRQQLRGRWVRFTGWLFWDFHHRGEAANTNPTGSNVWRATAWEVHPVTEIRVCPGSSATGC